MHPAPPLHGLHPPALHTPPGHEVPLPLLLPSTHTALPVPQSMTPLRQAAFGFVVHPPPALHALQKPPLHTPPGHVAPLGLLLPSEHTGLPVPHVMEPYLQTEPGLVVQSVPSLQALHAPELQTPPLHVVPFILLLPSTQTAFPVLQLMMPFLHAAPGLVVHAAPSLQALHEPALHTPPAHTVPFGLLAPSTQTAAPDEHSTVPSRQADPGLVAHDAPCVHETHCSEALHTRLVPHEAPVPLRAPFAQTGAPDVHAMEPLKHGLVGVHVAPALQFAHTPALSQTWLVPHVVPGALLPPSMQRSAPVLQSVTPFLQSPGLPPQVLPAAHAMQPPVPLHTWPAPQFVPAAVLPLSRHTVLPVAQSVRPVRQGAPGFEVQTLFATHAPQVPLESQTCPEPHIVPGALLLPSTQRCAPVLHSVMPLRQPGFGLVVQARFAVHVMQEPVALHT